MAASYLAAPRFSEEDEALEKASMTTEEKLSVLSDLFGNLPIPQHEMDALTESTSTASSPLQPVHVEETEELVASALCALEEALVEAIESSNNGSGREDRYSLSLLPTAPYQQAKSKCPSIVDSKDHRLLFLRAENFDAKLAAERLLRYWDNRIAIFGEAYAFGPLTLGSGAFDGDSTELSLGYPRLSPKKDKSGRPVILFNHSEVKRNTYNRNGMIRACWYTIHRAIEEEIVQKRGIVMLGLGYGQLDQIDRKLDASIWRNIVNILPVRIAACHIVVGPKSHDLILPNVKFFFGRRARARLREYSGNDPQILYKLEQYGIESTIVPCEIGGSWAYDEKWFEK